MRAWSWQCWSTTVRGWVASSRPRFCPLLPNKLLTSPGELLLGQGEAPHGKDLWKRNPPAFRCLSYDKTTFRKEEIHVECSGQALAQRRS